MFSATARDGWSPATAVSGRNRRSTPKRCSPPAANTAPPSRSTRGPNAVTRRPGCSTSRWRSAASSASTPTPTRRASSTSSAMAPSERWTPASPSIASSTPGRSTSCWSGRRPDLASGQVRRSGALAVILSFVAEAEHVVLIHGSWGRGEQLAPARAAFEERGYTAHTPTLRHHELPSREGAMKVAALSLRDYSDDLVTFVNSLDSPPLLVGHSMGGLLAQLVAARTHPAGLVAACPGPAAGILGASRTSLRATLPHLLRPRPWTKPWRLPTFEQFRRWAANTQTDEI